MSAFLRKKSIEKLQQNSTKNIGLQRVGLWQLTAIGLGGIIGVGIFVLTGVAASKPCRTSRYFIIPYCRAC
jgi:APA family basic amino acid/polyamine antiporter